MQLFYNICAHKKKNSKPPYKTSLSKTLFSSPENLLKNFFIFSIFARVIKFLLN